MKAKRLLTATFAAALMSSSASAATINYYLGTSPSYLGTPSSCGPVDAGPNPDDANCLSGGLSLNIKGYRVNTSTGAFGSQLDLDSAGHNGVAIGSDVDNVGPDEALALSFGNTVTLKSLTFGRVDSNDEVMIGVLASIGSPASPYYYYNIPGSGVSALPLPGAGNSPLVGSLFVVGTTPDSSGPDNDNWTLKYVSVDYTAPIPLPAAGWLLLAGLGGLGVFKRRRKTV